MPTPYEVEQQLAAELDGLTTAQEQILIAAWAAAWSEISGDLTDTLADLMDDGTEITAGLIVRSQRLATVLAGIVDRLEDLTEAAGVTMTRDLAAALDLGVDATGRLIAAQLDDLPNDEGDDRAELFDRTARPVPAALEAIIERTTQQITSELLPVADDTYAIIQRELVRGIAVGTGPRDTAQLMVERAEDHFNFGLNRALTIARTETLDAYRAAAQAAEEPHTEVLAGWAWLAHLGPRTCRSCLSMHGQVFDLDVTGPKDHQQGRCSRCPLVRGRDGADPDTSWIPDADDHFASLTPEQQTSLLGIKGRAAWQAGDFPREAWTKTRRTDGWRDSQVPAPAPARAAD
ncbi:phage minor head protein [Nocardioides sp. AX2bis]|uniref:phage minor head protein n=1 Tax=Nocardioides sp. AX2bis TaxID=2653157 RepID=UPI0012F307B6|nr:phage minor head protein [Nocardioides sp. AX2bis]VXC44435.1 hypothetical protein NOCARDAX2BIS_590024 [Nocardioides sp. AX2bis]